MKLFTVLSAAAFATLGLADEQEEVQFLTAFVSDYASNKKQYVDYFMTAKSLPAGLTQLAVQVATYTDDSYTTLINDKDVDITSLMSFATGLPWYTRIEAEEGGSVAAAGSSGSSGSSSPSSGSSKSSSSAGEAGLSLVAPGSALVGAVALLLL